MGFRLLNIKTIIPARILINGKKHKSISKKPFNDIFLKDHLQNKMLSELPLG